MYQNVSIVTIAKAANVSTATVSRALRNDPRISETTRKKITEIAQSLGYRPNPLVSIFQSHVRTGRQATYQANIAWIDDQTLPGRWHSVPWLRPYYDGANQRALELGYKLEIIRLEELRDWSPDLNVARFAKILEARGIYGAILPMLTHTSLVAGEWPCAIAELGSSTISLETASRPAFRPRYWHKVIPDYFFNTHLAMRQILELGYTRPGLVISNWYDRFTDWRVKGAYLAEQQVLPPHDRIPPLLLENIADVRQLRLWLEQHKPDCILCSHGQMRAWLQEAGKAVPRDLGLVHIGHAEDVADWAGVDERHLQLGQAAVDVVVAQLHRNERGQPAVARTIAIQGIWCQGSTVRDPAVPRVRIRRPKR